MDKRLKQKNRLLTTYPEVNMNALEDVIYIFAANIEDALITGGAIPDKDYSILDLYKLAMPFSLDYYKDDRTKVDFSVGYPVGHPQSSQWGME